MANTWYIGVDCGVKGGLALIDPSGAAIEYDPMPDTAKGIKDWLDDVLLPDRRVVMVVEQQQPMPGNKGRVSVVSTASMMRRFGQWEIFALMNGLPYHEVRPATWKKALGIASEKRTSIALCEQLFPTVNLVLPRCRVKHDGMAEALLIAYYGRRAGL